MGTEFFAPDNSEHSKLQKRMSQGSINELACTGEDGDETLKKGIQQMQRRSSAPAVSWCGEPPVRKEKGADRPEPQKRKSFEFRKSLLFPDGSDGAWCFHTMAALSTGFIPS